MPLSSWCGDLIPAVRADGKHLLWRLSQSLLLREGYIVREIKSNLEQAHLTGNKYYISTLFFF